MNSREIVYIIKMRNESREAIRQLAEDLRGLNQAMGNTPVAGLGAGRGPAASVGGGGGRGPNAPGMPSMPAAPDPQEWTKGMGLMVESLRTGAASFLSLAAAMTGIGVASLGVVGALAGIVKAADQANTAIGRLNAALGSRNLAIETYDQLARTAASIGINVNSSVDAFLRFDLAARQMGRSREEAMRFSETVQKLAIVSGTSAAEAAGAFLQLGQGLASGRLQGDELRSILEQMPQLAEVIASSMGVAVGQLRALGSEGRLTPEIIFKAVLEAQQRVNTQFAQMPLTVERASVQMQAGFAAVARRIDETLGISNNLARVMQALGNVAQRTADNMAPATALDRLREQQALVARLSETEEQRRQRQDRERQDFVQRDQAAARARMGSPSEQRLQLQPEQRNPQRPQSELELARQELAIREEQYRMSVRLAEQDRQRDQRVREEGAAATRRSQAQEAMNVALEAYGLKNDEVSRAIQTLNEVVASGDQAMTRYGVNINTAATALGLLQAKADPLIATIRALNKEFGDIIAQGQGGAFNLEVRRRFMEAVPEGDPRAQDPQFVNATLETIRADVRRNRAAQQGFRNDDDARNVDEENRLATARRNSDTATAARIVGERRYREVLLETGDASSAQRAREIAEQGERNAAAQRQAGSLRSLAEVVREVRQAVETARVAYEAEAQGQGLSTAAAQARTQALKVGRDGTTAYQEAYRQLLALYEQEQSLVARREALQEVRRVNAETEALKAETTALRTLNDERERAIAVEAARIRGRLVAAGRPVDDQSVQQRATAAVDNRAAGVVTTITRETVNRIESLREEERLVGLTGAALDRQRAVIEVNNRARQAGVSLSDQERNAAVEQLETLASARRALQGDPFAGLRSGIARFMEDSANIFEQVEQATTRMANSMTEAITEFVMTGKANFSDFAASVIRDLVRIAAQQAIVRPIMGFLGGAFGGVGGFLSGMFGGGVNHDGGIIGDTRRVRHVAAETWDHAPRFHMGGMPGMGGRSPLDNDEVPIIARRGEAIFPTLRGANGAFAIKGIIEPADGGQRRETTVEVARMPGGDFGVRISMARIAQDVQRLQAAAGMAQENAQAAALMVQAVVSPSQGMAPQELSEDRLGPAAVQPVATPQVIVQLVRANEVAVGGRETREVATQSIRDLRSLSDVRAAVRETVERSTTSDAREVSDSRDTQTSVSLRDLRSVMMESATQRERLDASVQREVRSSAREVLESRVRTDRSATSEASTSDRDQRQVVTVLRDQRDTSDQREQREVLSTVRETLARQEVLSISDRRDQQATRFETRDASQQREVLSVVRDVLETREQRGQNELRSAVREITDRSDTVLSAQSMREVSVAVRQVLETRATSDQRELRTAIQQMVATTDEREVRSAERETRDSRDSVSVRDQRVIQALRDTQVFLSARDTRATSETTATRDVRDTRQSVDRDTTQDTRISTASVVSTALREIRSMLSMRDVTETRSTDERTDTTTNRSFVAETSRVFREVMSAVFSQEMRAGFERIDRSDTRTQTDTREARDTRSSISSAVQTQTSTSSSASTTNTVATSVSTQSVIREAINALVAREVRALSEVRVSTDTRVLSATRDASREAISTLLSREVRGVADTRLQTDSRTISTIQSASRDASSSILTRDIRTASEVRAASDSRVATDVRAMVREAITSLFTRETRSVSDSRSSTDNRTLVDLRSISREAATSLLSREVRSVSDSRTASDVRTQAATTVQTDARAFSSTMAASSSDTRSIVRETVNDLIEREVEAISSIRTTADSRMVSDLRSVSREAITSLLSRDVRSLTDTRTATDARLQTDTRSVTREAINSLLSRDLRAISDVRVATDARTVTDTRAITRDAVNTLLTREVRAATSTQTATDSRTATDARTISREAVNTLLSREVRSGTDSRVTTDARFQADNRTVTREVVNTLMSREMRAVTDTRSLNDTRTIAREVMNMMASRDVRTASDTRTAMDARSTIREVVPGRAPAVTAAITERGGRGAERALASGAVFAPQVNVTVQAPAGGGGPTAQGGNRGPEQEKMFGELIARMVRDGIRAEMAEFLAMQQRSGGMLKPVASL